MGDPMTKTVYYLIEQLWTDSMENTVDDPP
jgi:uncharacterized membrane protein